LAQRWVDIEPALSSVISITEIEGNLYSIASTGELGQSTDNGQSWEVINILAENNLPDILPFSITFFDVNFGLIALREPFEGKRLLRTLDGGQTWNLIDSNFNDCIGFSSPIDFKRISDSRAIVLQVSSSNAFVTDDRGESWICYDSISHVGLISVSHIHNENEWYRNGNGGIFKTIDAGETWNKILQKDIFDYQVKTNGEIYALSFRSTEPGGYYTLYRSEDDFQSYDSIPLMIDEDIDINLFVLPDESSIYLHTTKDEIYLSEDDGQNFEFVQELSNYPLKKDFINDTWYLSGRGLWRFDETATSLDDVFDIEYLHTYPNPSTKTLHIDSEEFESYQLMNTQGIIVKFGMLQQPTINIESLPSGLYYLSLINGVNTIIEEVIKY
jgi:photosystem II stability/assembly factor-like uncharacterized protein